MTWFSWVADPCNRMAPHNTARGSHGREALEVDTQRLEGHAAHGFREIRQAFRAREEGRCRPETRRPRAEGEGAAPRGAGGRSCRGARFWRRAQGREEQGQGSALVPASPA